MRLVSELRRYGFRRYDGSAKIGPCIYVLAYRHRPLYVGRTTLLYNRLAVHRSRQPWRFSACYYLEARRADLPGLERAFTRLLEPEHNNQQRREPVNAFDRARLAALLVATPPPFL